MNMRRRKFEMPNVLAERLQEMLELFKRENVVSRIRSAENWWSEFQEIQRELKVELEEFKNVQQSNPSIPNEKIPGKESVPIVLLCMMAGVSDEELFQKPNELDFALRTSEADEEYGIIAENMFYEVCRSGLKGKDPKAFLKEVF